MSTSFANIPLASFKEHYVYALDEILIVFHSKSISLHLLDELSSWLFLSLDAGLSKAELKNELIENNIDSELLEIAFERIEEILKPPPVHTSYKQEYTDIIASLASSPSNLSPLVCITLLGKKFQVYSACPHFKNYLQSVFINNLGDSSWHDDNTDYHINVKPVEDAYQLICNGTEVSKIEKYNFIMPRLMDHMQILAYQSIDYLFAVHSAMLTYKGRGVMLPGSSGSGKSTLAVSLLAKGFQCLSDEIAVIAGNDNKLMPLPLPAAIKSGSWEVIQSDFPDIDELPTWERNDGRRSKYIALPYSDNNLPETTVKCIVFPHYQASIKETELVSMDSISALKQLTSAGYQIRDGLTKEKVEQILGWISITPAYHLSYSNLNDAHDVIEKLMTT